MILGSGYVALVEGVKKYIATYLGDGTTVHGGFRGRFYQSDTDPIRGANRIVIMPGDPTSGDTGSIVPPRGVGYTDEDEAAGQITRPLVDWDRLLTLSIWGVDNTDPRSEFLQIGMTETLFEWAVRAISYVAQANLEWGNVKWTKPADNSFGLELIVQVTLRQQLFDLPLDVGYPSGVLNKPQ